jgi:hypothetical protein
MSLPNEVRSHQTVWIDVPGGRTPGVRYEMDGDRIVCFGDDGLSGLVTGSPAATSRRSSPTSRRCASPGASCAGSLTGMLPAKSWNAAPSKYFSVSAYQAPAAIAATSPPR